MSWLTQDAGKKIKLPGWTQISPTQNQIDTAQGNLDALPSANEFAKAANQSKLAELESLMGLSPDTLKQIGENIGSQAKGEIPTDVSDAVQRNAAVRSLGGGYAGSGMNRNLVARDLGLTSLQLTDRALR